jgi:uncharacterized protein YndB with AHSA1/START domain
MAAIVCLVSKHYVDHVLNKCFIVAPAKLHGGHSMFELQTRRDVLAALAAGTIGASGALGLLTAVAADDDLGIDRAAEAIRQSIQFTAPKHRVYAALTDSAQFHKLTLLSLAAMGGAGQPTAIGARAGEAFTLFAGHIAGRQIELVPDQRIVQAWRTADWAPGWYSIAHFELSDDGGTTRLDFNHTGFPKGQAEHLAEGWQSHYWQPLARFLA